jgi:hypothetical protein
MESAKLAAERKANANATNSSCKSITPFPGAAPQNP